MSASSSTAPHDVTRGFLSSVFQIIECVDDLPGPGADMDDWTHIYFNLPTFEVMGHLCLPRAESIVFGPDVQMINEFTFGVGDHTIHIKQVAFWGPDTVIGDGSFARCVHLHTVQLPGNLRIVSPKTFCGCELLQNVYMPLGLERIETHAFCNCAELKDVEIPPTVTFIGQAAFSGCGSVLSIVLPSRVELASRSFERCTKLQSIHFVPIDTPTITEIPTMAFAHCSNLRTVVLPPSVADIGECAFFNCQKLEDFTATNMCTVGKHAFAYCHCLEAFDHPTVKFIAEGAFYNCCALSLLVVPLAINIVGGTFVNTRVRCLVFGDGLQSISLKNFYNDPISYVTCPEKFLSVFAIDRAIKPHTVKVYAGESSIIEAHKHRYISWRVRVTVPVEFMLSFLCSINRSSTNNRSINRKPQFLPPIPNELVWNILSFVQVAHTHKEDDCDRAHSD